uniref:BEN domain containing 2 n=1 Tax=Cricetulus griseus TaxID=10029 RepID=A0A8C2LZW9_CRIGR
MDSDSDNVSDDGDEVLSEYFGSDVIPDTSSDGALTLDSELEDSDDNLEEQPLHDIEDEHGEDNGVNGDNEGEAEDDNEDGEENRPPENFKRPNPSSIDFSQLNKRGRPSGPEDFVHLEELLERTDKRISHIYETVSRMQEFCEKSQKEKCTEQATQSQDNPEEIVPEPVAEANPEKLASDIDIVPNDEVAQRNDNAVPSSEQPAVEAPITVFQPIEPILVGNNALIMSNPTFEENHEENNNFNPPVFDLPVIPEAVLGNNAETVNYPPAMGNVNGQQNSSIMPAPDSEIKEVVLVEMPKKTEVIVDGNKQTVYYPALLGNVVPPDPETIASSRSSDEVEKLTLVEMPVHPENIVDDNPETLNNPIMPGNDGDQEPDAASFVSAEIGEFETTLLISNFPCILEGYLGDPRRNIRLPDFHLVTAKTRTTPSNAACYLANLIFSEEIPLLRSFFDHASCIMFMNHNKMSAIREYLSTVFPNCDLSEQGKAWEDCLSAIRFMINNLYSEAEIPMHRNFSVPISTDWNIRSDYESQVPSQCFQEVRETVIREIGNFGQTASANPEGTDNAAIMPDELVYLGDPSRNIQIPYSVLKIAKARLLPYMSAKYIILHLFPEEILIRSNVYGNLECGLFALDPNRIEALREFLQDNYPQCDLEETGYYWKLCVIAISSCLQILRQGPRNVLD